MGTRRVRIARGLHTYTTLTRLHQIFQSWHCTIRRPISLTSSGARSQLPEPMLRWVRHSTMEVRQTLALHTFLTLRALHQQSHLLLSTTQILAHPTTLVLQSQLQIIFLRSGARLLMWMPTTLGQHTFITFRLWAR